MNDRIKSVHGVEQVVLPSVRPSPVVNSKEVTPEVPNEPQKPSSAETELKKVEKDFIVGEQREQMTVYYGVGGKEVEESEPYFAKTTLTKNSDGSESIRYSLALYNGSIYNPAGQFSGRNKRVKDYFTFKACDEKCFNDYLEFLDTKRESTYWRANRGILNG